MQVHVGPAHLGLVPAGQRDVQGLVQRARPLPAGHPDGAGLGVERVAEHLGQAQWPGHLLRPPGQLDRLPVDAAHHPHRPQSGVCPGQLGGRAQRFEQFHRRPGGGDAFIAPAQGAHRGGKPAKRVALAQPVTHLAPQVERPLPGVGRLLPAVQQRRLVCEAVMQTSGRGGIGLIGEAQRPFELGGRLTVRAQRGGPASGRGRVPQCRLAIAGRLRVERHAGVVVTSEGLQRRKDLCVDRGGPVGDHRSRYREPRDLMTELQRHAIPGEQAGCQQFVDRRRRAADDGVQERDLYLGADQRGGVQHRTRVAAQPHGLGQHRIPGGHRHVAHPRLHGLADVERVAAGQPV